MASAATASTTGAVMDQNEELACVLIPTTDDSLLLPNVCVAEIMPWRRLKSLSNGPQWCLGFAGWRGLSIPVIDYPALNDKPGSGDAGARCLIVMNRSRTSEGTWASVRTASGR